MHIKLKVSLRFFVVLLVADFCDSMMLNGDFVDAERQYWASLGVQDISVSYGHWSH